jgi:hypothetical protein
MENTTSTSQLLDLVNITGGTQITGGNLIAVLAPHAARHQMLALTARLARLGPLRVLDGGNRFNAYQVARALRRESADGFKAALERTQVARAFTPYQMFALLESTPASPRPTLVLDMLNTFYDESLPHTERQRILERCVAHLRRLSTEAVVAVSVRPPPPSQPDPQGLVDIIQQAADQVLFFEELTSPSQPALF